MARELLDRGMVYPDFVFALLLRAAPAILERIMGLPSNALIDPAMLIEIEADAVL